MAGVWYCVCIPTESHEGKINPCDSLDEKRKLDVPEVKYQPNGNVVNNNRVNNNIQDSCVIQLPDEKKDQNPKENEDDNTPLATLLERELHKLGIFDSVWTTNKEGTFHHVYFPCGPGLRSDYVLRSLMEKGIGVRSSSTVGIVPCAVFYRDEELELTETLPNEEEKPIEIDTKALKGFKAMQKEFLKSVTARLTVAQVVEQVRSGGTLNFDFILFAFVAGMVAALGLMENSSVNIVASMLISPIMGPIMSITFGAVIRDKSLIVTGLKTELFGLSMCIINGFMFGLIFGNFADENWGPPGPWPTPEQAARGMTRSLWMGVLVALPSGAGVALSILGGNSSSLVGVAISASLLPPSINCGMLWGLSFIRTMKSLSEDPVVVFYNGGNFTMKPSLLPPRGYTPTYYYIMNKECVVLGILSFMLTVVNICCILIAAYIVLKVKEVAPHTSVPKTSRFWKHDIKIAREYNRTPSKVEGDEMGKQFLKEWANLAGLDPKELMGDSQEARITQMQTLKDIMQDVEADDVYQTVMKSMPGKPGELSRHLDLSNWSQNSDDDTISKNLPAVWDVNFAPDPSDDKNKPRRRSVIQTLFSGQDDGSKAEAAKRRRCSKAPSFKSDPLEEQNETISENIPRLPVNLPPAAQRSRMLRHSLQYSESPFTLWPSQVRRISTTQAPRFEVIPVEEINRIRRRSRLQSRDQTTNF